MDQKLYNPLKEELVQMAEADQTMRNRAMQGEQWDLSIDAANTERLKVIVHEYGWPTSPEFGIEGSQAAWLIAQHADHDVDFQSECLELMKKQNPAELNPAHLAYLEDRVRVNQGRPQLYGTQFFGTGAELKPRPIEDKEHLDERRAKVGLGSFEDYKNQIEEIDRTSEH
jgi:hypothetical protein